ncbi:hypothetical protein CDL12_24332 [Handroanthus impetiginosus]|uniref:Retrotransposon gag domain-containing protein n=1 Tax=Handroanthus impetiginosus TaxID=429701 RepID=A0A2G9GCZ1_9LAMI|nr:hypothetical protein CDL12_24332 [Handroanthus impetiginosus]
MENRSRRSTQNPRYATNPDKQNDSPSANMHRSHVNDPNMQNEQQPSNPPTIVQARIGRDDLIAIATAVAQAVQIQNQHQAPAPNPQPTTMGTKFHFEALKRAQVPTFDGTHDPEIVQRWLKEMEDNFDLMEVPLEVRPKVVVPFLVGEAARWWEDMSVVEYSARFHSLGKYSPAVLADPELKIHKFTRGLKSRIQSALAVFEARSFDELLGAAIRAEADIKRRDEENKLKRPRNEPKLVQGSPPEALANPTNKKGPTLPRPQFPEATGNPALRPTGNPTPRPINSNPGLKPNGNARVFAMTQEEESTIEDRYVKFRGRNFL